MSVEPYQLTDNDGESKYYRINNIETYLQKLGNESNQMKDALRVLEESVANNQRQGEQKFQELETQLLQIQTTLANLVEKKDWEELKQEVAILQKDFSALVKRILKQEPPPTPLPTP